jgi:hypothetical protein
MAYLKVGLTMMARSDLIIPSMYPISMLVTGLSDTPGHQALFNVHWMKLTGQELRPDYRQWFGSLIPAGIIEYVFWYFL